MSDLRRRMARLPVRVRLTLVFALVAGIALAGVAGVLYLRFESELNRTIDADLRSRAQALAALVAQQGPSAVGGTTAERLLRPQGAFAQVLRAPEGATIAASPAVAGRTLLRRDEAQRATRHGVLVTRRLPGLSKRARIAAGSVPRRPGLVAVVGRSLKDREGANESFARALLIGGPLAVLFTSLAAYGLVSAALRPVERMRRRAATISSAEPGARLPVAEADDEIGRLGRTLNDMLGRLEASFAQQRALTANASHELRTPLAVLSSTLEVSLRHARTPEEQEQAIREALAETRRLAHLAEELLLLARLDEQDRTADADGVSVSDVVGAVVERLREPAALEGRTVDATVSDELRVRCDPVQLERAVDNLVTNAIVHGRGAVTVAAERVGGRVAVHVRDEGPGLGADFAPHAFDRFTRDPGAQERPGSGLGLSIVRAVAERHGGEAGVTDGPHADVWISLPGD